MPLGAQGLCDQKVLEALEFSVNMAGIEPISSYSSTHINII